MIHFHFEDSWYNHVLFLDHELEPSELLMQTIQR